MGTTAASRSWAGRSWGRPRWLSALRVLRGRRALRGNALNVRRSPTAQHGLTTLWFAGGPLFRVHLECFLIGREALRGITASAGSWPKRPWLIVTPSPFGMSSTISCSTPSPWRPWPSRFPAVLCPMTASHRGRAHDLLEMNVGTTAVARYDVF